MRTIMIASLCLALLRPLPGQPTRTVRPADNARRVALVIGNNAYPWGRLTNAASDAQSLATALESAGFDRANITIKIDANLRDMQRTIRAFVESIRSGDLAFVYYSGHGVEVRGKNYLLPIDFSQDATELQVSDEAYSAQELLEKIESSGARVKLLVMDACRDNPLKVASRTTARGLGRMEGEGTLIMFATSAGKTATDSGVFRRELARGILTPGIAADEALKRVARAVNRATDGKQTPAIYGLLLEDFSFVAGAVSPSLSEPLSREPVAPQQGDVRINPKDGQRYAFIPPGTFRMGCSTGDTQCYSNESPAREVAITKGFWLGQTEVTVQAYQRFAKAAGRAMPAEPKWGDRNLNPGWANTQMPMVNVDWNDSHAYCEAAGARLPTEAEWEFAARGRSTEARYGALPEIAWFGDNAGKDKLDADKIWKDEHKEYHNRLHANENQFRGVALKKPNAYGLYDMFGNAFEWTADWYGEKYYETGERRNPQGPPNGEQKVLRGGSWDLNSRYLRVSLRGRYEPSERFNSFGFRCAWD